MLTVGQAQGWARCRQRQESYLQVSHRLGHKLQALLRNNMENPKAEDSPKKCLEEEEITSSQA